MWRSVSGPSDSPCPQAVINYRHVSSAQTPPSLPPLCDTGRIIILTSNNNNNKKNASAILVLEEFSPPAFCQPPLSGISAVETSTECTQFAPEKSTILNVLVFSVGMSRTHRELTDNARLVESTF